MSDRPAQREWRFYVEDMVAFCDKVIGYTQGLDRVSFETGSMRHDAVLRNLELIGEAATHVPNDARALAPDVPWRMVVAMRNRLIHGYLGIDDDTIWSVIQDDLVPLHRGLTELLASHS